MSIIVIRQRSKKKKKIDTYESFDQIQRFVDVFVYCFDCFEDLFV